MPRWASEPGSFGRFRTGRPAVPPVTHAQYRAMLLDREAVGGEVAGRACSHRFRAGFSNIRSGFRSGMGEACACAADRFDRQRRHVVGGGGTAGGAGRVRGHKGRGFAGLYHDHARLRPGRRRHRPDHRSLRHRDGDGGQHRPARARLSHGRALDHAAAIHRDLFPDRARHSGDLCTADGRGVALVRTLSRARRHHRRERELRRRHDLAAAGQLGCAVGRLAHHAYRHRYILCRQHGAGAAGVARPDRRSHPAELTRTRRRRGSICKSAPMR